MKSILEGKAKGERAKRTANDIDGWTNIKRWAVFGWAGLTVKSRNKGSWGQ